MFYWLQQSESRLRTKQPCTSRTMGLAINNFQALDRAFNTVLTNVQNQIVQVRYVAHGSIAIGLSTASSWGIRHPQQVHSIFKGAEFGRCCGPSRAGLCSFLPMNSVRCGNAGFTLRSFRSRTTATVVLTFLASRCGECWALALVTRAGGLGRALAALDPSTCCKKELIHIHAISQCDILSR